MVAIVIAFIINTLIIFLTSYILPGVRLFAFWYAAVVAVVLGLTHSFVHHYAMMMMLPPNFFTYFLLSFVIASIAIYLLSKCLSGFEVDGFKWVVMFSFIIAFFNAAIHHFFLMF
jgi:uncharacterized membrane protein YvlD (DUF360 family)